MSQTILKLEAVNKTFFPNTEKEKTVLKDIHLDIHAGDFITIIGGNGAGKSTLLNVIAGSYPITSGSMSLKGEAIDKQSEEARARHIARVFQDPLKGTAPRMTVAENLALAYRRGERRSLRKILTPDLYASFLSLLEEVGLNLDQKIDDDVGNLSGGQRQTIAMLMATLKRPDILLLDEHVAALDPNASRVVMDLTRDRVEKDQITTLMITHNMQHAIEYGNRLIMMDKGRIIYDVKGEEKAGLTVAQLLDKFVELGDENNLTDKMLFEANARH